MCAMHCLPQSHISLYKYSILFDWLTVSFGCLLLALHNSWWAAPSCLRICKSSSNFGTTSSPACAGTSSISFLHVRTNIWAYEIARQTFSFNLNFHCTAKDALNSRGPLTFFVSSFSLDTSLRKAHRCYSASQTFFFSSANSKSSPLQFLCPLEILQTLQGRPQTCPSAREQCTEHQPFSSFYELALLFQLLLQFSPQQLVWQVLHQPKTLKPAAPVHALFSNSVSKY